MLSPSQTTLESRCLLILPSCIGDKPSKSKTPPEVSIMFFAGSSVVSTTGSSTTSGVSTASSTSDSEMPSSSSIFLKRLSKLNSRGSVGLPAPSFTPLLTNIFSCFIASVISADLLVKAFLSFSSVEDFLVLSRMSR